MSDGCCAKGTKFTVKSVFILLNLVVILFSLLLVIYQIVNTVTDFGDSWNDDIASILNVSTVAVSTFMVVSTLLASFFSALAAYGMEAANFRRYWDDPIFEICCCNLLKLKMMIYILVTGIGGIALVVVVILLQTNVIYVDINDQLRGIVRFFVIRKWPRTKPA